MALHASVGLKPGDYMQIQFPTSSTLRVTAVVRNRTGDCLGLEFLTQLPPDDKAMDGSAEFRGNARDSCNPETLYAGLRRKQQELKQVQREIEALNMAIPLLAEDATEQMARGQAMSSCPRISASGPAQVPHITALRP